MPPLDRRANSHPRLARATRPPLAIDLANAHAFVVASCIVALVTMRARACDVDVVESDRSIVVSVVDAPTTRFPTHTRARAARPRATNG